MTPKTNAQRQAECEHWDGRMCGKDGPCYRPACIPKPLAAKTNAQSPHFHGEWGVASSDDPKPPKTNADRQREWRLRQAAERKAHREQGRLAVTVWIRPDDKARLDACVARLNRQKVVTVAESPLTLRVTMAE